MSESDPTFWWSFWHVLTLQSGYNSTLVILGTATLGVASGIVGTFAVLRRRALMADALGHATLPGIAGGFLISILFGADGPELLPLLIGGAVSGALGVLVVQALVLHPRVREDAAIGLVLSVFFGVGVVLLGVVQNSVATQSAGLESFIYGQASTMTQTDVVSLFIISCLVVSVAVVFRNVFGQVCFDADFALSTGWPVGRIDILMMTLVTVMCVAGIPAAGLMLVVAFLIIPPAAARLWSVHLHQVLFVSAVIGGVSGWVGATLSATLPRLPTGPVIVLVSGCIFFISLLFAPRRGWFARKWKLRARDHQIEEDHALEHFFEEGGEVKHDQLATLFAIRGWSSWKISRLVRRLRVKRFVEDHRSVWILTEAGQKRGAKIQRNHALWTQFLISHADVAANHVDWSVDQVEHVLSDELVAQLEAELTGGHGP